MKKMIIINVFFILLSVFPGENNERFMSLCKNIQGFEKFLIKNEDNKLFEKLYIGMSRGETEKLGYYLGHEIFLADKLYHLDCKFDKNEEYLYFVGLHSDKSYIAYTQNDIKVIERDIIEFITGEFGSPTKIEQILDDGGLTHNKYFWELKSKTIIYWLTYEGNSSYSQSISIFNDTILTYFITEQIQDSLKEMDEIE